MSSSELAYLAGFIDGEGSYIVSKRLHTTGKWTYVGYSIGLDIANTNKEVMEWIREKTNNNSKVYLNPQKGNRKLAYRLRINGKLAQKITKEIFPYLIVKREQSKVFLQFPLNRKKLQKSKREEIFQKMKRLNHRGIL